MSEEKIQLDFNDVNDPTGFKPVQLCEIIRQRM